jgi:sulfonate transport system substrate-binding protein
MSISERVMLPNRATLQASPAAFKTILRVSQELAELAHQSPEKFQKVFLDKGPTALSGDELRISVEETRVVPAFHAPGPGDRERIANVAKVLR